MKINRPILGLTFISLAAFINHKRTTMKTKNKRTFASTLLAVIGLSGVFPALAQNGTWTTKESLPTTRAALAVAAGNGVLYAVGGTISGCCNWTGRMDAYDPSSDSWTNLASMPAARDGLGVGVANGLLFAVGGWNGSIDQAVNQAYDPVSNTWSTKAPMPTRRRGLAVGVVNGILYAMGGGAAFVPLSPAVEAYDPSSNTWTSRSPIPTPRAVLAVVAVNGIIYAIGGHDVNGTDLTAVEAYDPASDTWSTKAPMPLARSHLAAAEVNGIIYVVGGLASNVPLATVQAYDPAANTWSETASMPTPRRNLGAGALNGVLYAVGGSNQDGNNLSTNEAFTPAPRVSIRCSQVEVCWTSAQGTSYQVQYRSDFTTNMWTDFGPSRQGIGTNDCVTDPVPAGQPQRFYQVVTSP